MANTFSSAADLPGRGIALPLRLEGGSVGMNEGEERIRQSILLILGTAANERMMRPEFGAGMERLVFEPINAVTGILLQQQVRAALTRYEPRIDLLAVSTEATPEQGALRVDIRYRVRQTGALGSLVYPFPLDGGTR